MTTTAAIEHAAASDRRLEIEEWHSSLSTRTDAEMLELQSGALPTQVKAAFISMARRFHPDTLGVGDDLQPQLQSIFLRISEAYRNLCRQRPLPIESVSIRPAPGAPETPPQVQVSAPSDVDERRARVETALRTADDLIERELVEEAVAVLHEVLTQADQPRRRRIRLLLARAYAKDAQRRRHAVAFLRELIEQNPHDAEALAGLGDLYRREGLLSRAEQMLARALATDPGLAEARAGLRSVRAARAANAKPSRNKRAPRRGLISRLLSVAR